MAYIQLDSSLPGMQSLLAYRPLIAAPMQTLMWVMMRSDEGLSKGERELIASYVSSLNDCYNCHQIQGEVAQCFFENQPGLIENVKSDFRNANLTERQKAILGIAGNVQKSGKLVTDKQIHDAKGLGITDLEIHDTVLIAAMFCFFNRYIDGLGIVSQDTPETFKARAKMITEFGYGH
jgi:uncharacterized peroxidase-related enzyme